MAASCEKENTIYMYLFRIGQKTLTVLVKKNKERKQQTSRDVLTQVSNQVATVRGKISTDSSHTEF